MSEPLRATYSLTPDDYVALNMYLLRKTLPSDAFFPYERVSVTLFVWLGAGLLASQPGWLIPALAVFAAGSAYPFLGRGAARKNAEAMFRQQVSGLTGEVTLTLTDMGLVEQTDSGRVGALWNDVSEVTEAGEYCYIFLPDAAVIVPRAGFADDRDYRVIRDFARGKFADRRRHQT